MYYLFRTLSLSFYYTHYCKILLYYIIYYIVNTQFSLVAASFLQINYLSIYLSEYKGNERERGDLYTVYAAILLAPQNMFKLWEIGKNEKGR